MKLGELSYQKIIDEVHDGIYIVDKERRIVFWNKSARRISGFTAEEVKGSFCSDNILVHHDSKGRALCKGLCPLAESILSGQYLSKKVYMHHKDGHRVPVWVRTGPVLNAKGAVTGGIEIFTDLSEQFQDLLEVEQLQKLALTDRLTGLPNRYCFETELRKIIMEKKRYGSDFGILFIDIDNFKRINDVYGHQAGDKILVMIGKVFIANSRIFDTYGRWGGEEFAGIVRNIVPQDLKGHAERIRILIENSFSLYRGIRLQVTSSLGATMIRDCDTVSSVIKRADSLMYESKRSGKNCSTSDAPFI